MSAPTLSTAQGILYAQLAAEAAKATSMLYGIPIVRQGYGFPNFLSEVEAAVNEGAKGMCIILVEPFAERQEAVANQVARVLLALRVFLAVNPVTNESGTGANKDPLQVLEAIWNAATNAPSKGPQIRLAASPLPEIEETSGLLMYQSDFEVPIIHKPT